MTGGKRLPEFVDEARVMSGTARCEDCGHTVRFDGEETYQEAVDLWFGGQHAGCDLRTDGGREPFTEPECYCHIFYHDEERCLVCIEERDQL